jgi:hypothetical protein
LFIKFSISSNGCEARDTDNTAYKAGVVPFALAQTSVVKTAVMAGWQLMGGRLRMQLANCKKARVAICNPICAPQKVQIHFPNCTIHVVERGRTGFRSDNCLGTAIAGLITMKTRLFVMGLSFAALLGAGQFRVAASFEVSAGINIQSPADFDEPLAANGAWVQVSTYGRCWHPAGVTAGWRPYCQGYWELTDCGWYWVSDEPWGWACYHYGTWAFDPGYGWVWIPGVEWAPAWVYWRTGGDYIGWAPCGPSGVSVDPAFYVFVEGRHFGDHVRPDTVIVNNPAIINKTTEIRNVTREQRQVGGRSQTVFVNHGPELAAVEKATGHKFTATPVEKVDQVTSRSAPQTLRQHTSEPSVRDSQHPIEQTPTTTHELPKPSTGPAGNQEIPHNFQPQPELPNRVVPPDRPVQPVPPDRTIPESPRQTIVPPGTREVPLDHGPQPPKQLIPPNQAPHPVVPVAPPGNPAGQNGDGKDKDHNQM